MALDSTVVNIALPTIAINLHTQYSGLQWIIDGYLLTLSALILIGGSLGDIFGQKRVFEWGVIGFGAASLACGISPSIEILTISRMVQGIFGALLVPSSLAVINTTFAAERRSRAIGLWTAYGGIFVALGPLIGGLLIGLSWRWIFFVNVPLAVLCLAIIRNAVLDPKHTGKRTPIDIIGGTLAVTGLAATTYGLIQGPADGWRNSSLLFLLAGLLIMCAFVLYERMIKYPMLPVSLFKSRNFTAANLMTVGMYAALGGTVFSVILYLQSAVGYTPIEAGLSFLPVTVIMFFFAGRIGALSGRLGPRLFLTTGPIIASIGFLAMLRVDPQHNNYFIYILPATLIFGCGLVLTVAPLTTTVMSSMPDTRSGIASAINNAVARLAGLLVIGFLGVFVASQTTHSFNTSRVHLSNKSVAIAEQAIAGGLKKSALAPLEADQRAAVKTTVRETQRGIYVNSMILSAILAFSAGIIALATIRNPRK